MKKLFLFFLITNTFFVTAQIQKNNQSALTIETIMQDPGKWIGTSPDNIVWDEQSDRVFFDWNPEQDTPQKTGQDEWLEKQQAELFDVLKQREAMDKAREFQQEKEKTVQPEKIYLGKKRLGNAVLIPTGKYVVYTTFNSPQGNKSTSVTHFVTESGYTEEKTARTKVGSALYHSEMGIFDVQNNKTIKIKTGEIPGLKDFPDYL